MGFQAGPGLLPASLHVDFHLKQRWWSLVSLSRCLYLKKKKVIPQNDDILSSKTLIRQQWGLIVWRRDCHRVFLWLRKHLPSHHREGGGLQPWLWERLAGGTLILTMRSFGSLDNAGHMFLTFLGSDHPHFVYCHICRREGCFHDDCDVLDVTVLPS